MEERIKETLIDLVDSIRKADGGAIAGCMARLDAYLEEGRAALHPQLVHYLERRSYPKALIFLGGEPAMPSGSGGGRS